MTRVAFSFGWTPAPSAFPNLGVKRGVRERSGDSLARKPPETDCHSKGAGGWRLETAAILTASLQTSGFRSVL